MKENKEKQRSETLNILFVCTGNICRSPMAEFLFRSRLMAGYPSLLPFVRASSAGISALEGNPATDTAVQALDLWELDLEPHRATPLTVPDLEEADLVLAMSRDHLLFIDRFLPAALGKCTTLKHLASREPEISGRLGERTVRGEREARSRVNGALAILGKGSEDRDFLSEEGTRASDIIDPIGSSLQVYIAVAEDIDSSLEAAMRALFGRPEVSAGRKSER